MKIPESVKALSINMRGVVHKKQESLFEIRKAELNLSCFFASYQKADISKVKY